MGALRALPFSCLYNSAVLRNQDDCFEWKLTKHPGYGGPDGSINHKGVLCRHLDSITAGRIQTALPFPNRPMPSGPGLWSIYSEPGVSRPSRASNLAGRSAP